MWRRLLFVAITALWTAPVLSQGTAPEKQKPNIIIDVPPPPVRTLTGATYPPLKDVILNVGDTVRLGREIDDGRAPGQGCMDKPGAKARFCLDPVDWPAPLDIATDADDIVHKGAQAIIRYDQGRSSQAHVLFPAQAFTDIVEALKDRYGPPTEQEMQIRDVPGDDRVANTVVRWKSIPAGDEDATAILEIRAFDDIRHPHPDRAHGLLWLHREGSEPPFRHFNTIDLMVLRQRRIGQWPPQTN
ncbi:MAG: hypothetical protein HOH04_15655 [Rhodospirillaceae bacterium]|jgi:hypothetical protein|nr:hypothetical protein [Rhodospirillaceae bacterium]